MMSKKHIQLSIITICYNEEKAIEDTCRSIIEQTYASYEWIVIDGGSTDDTGSILKKYRRFMSTFISEKDNGRYHAMNKGIKVSKGKYLLFLNGGDYLINKRILNEVFSAEQTDDLLCGGVRIYNKYDYIIHKPVNKWFFIEYSLAHQGTFIKKELFDKCGLYNEKYKFGGDNEWWLRAIVKYKINKIKILPYPISVFNLDGYKGTYIPRLLEEIKWKRIYFGNIVALVSIPLDFYRYMKIAFYHLIKSFKDFIKKLLKIFNINSDEVNRLCHKYLKIFTFRRNREISRSRWKAIQQRSIIKLELGSGHKSGSGGWVTVDQIGADINWDLREGIPLRNCSVDKIYSSHLLEHIPYEQLIPFLSECKRVLKTGGEFLVCVPNSRFYINAYISGKEFRNKSSWYQPALIDTGSSIDQLNYIAYMGGHHKYLFDEENLLKTLLKAGFSSAMPRKFDQELDLQERDMESIYAAAYK